MLRWPSSRCPRAGTARGRATEPRARRAPAPGRSRPRLIAVLLAVVVLCPAPGFADIEIDGPRAAAVPIPRPPPERVRPGVGTLCDLIVAAADAHGLQHDFFARLLWKESRFDTRAVSPVGAQGIAQFMPGTAKERGLADPYDPFQAIPASAHFLADLKAQFGNFGLAAAAYNGGPNRIARWLSRGGGLPWETVDYVRSITFRPVEWFREPGRQVEVRPLEDGVDFAAACRKMPIIATRAFAPGTEWTPWGVQVAGGITYGAANRAYARAWSRIRTIVGDKGAVIVRKRRGSGPRYSARVGVQTRAEARALCRRITAVGRPCVVRRN